MPKLMTALTRLNRMKPPSGPAGILATVRPPLDGTRSSSWMRLPLLMMCQLDAATSWSSTRTSRVSLKRRRVSLLLRVATAMSAMVVRVSSLTLYSLTLDASVYLRP